MYKYLKKSKEIIDINFFESDPFYPHAIICCYAILKYYPNLEDACFEIMSNFNYEIIDRIDILDNNYKLIEKLLSICNHSIKSYYHPLNIKQTKEKIMIPQHSGICYTKHFIYYDEEKQSKEISINKGLEELICSYQVHEMINEILALKDITLEKKITSFLNSLNNLDLLEANSFKDFVPSFKKLFENDSFKDLIDKSSIKNFSKINDDFSYELGIDTYKNLSNICDKLYDMYKNKSKNDNYNSLLNELEIIIDRYLNHKIICKR